ncbi:NUDIX hydrolase domain protein [Kalmanozyma brasiliensis GHG001]|uniref:NAD(+) diphosphatase n=1 Tax=Kalmanozyma brasiliensis (strain GHG001) TaxID=1365824 RepID=V5EWR4_KALBG|nr:NUDIX hydrolase domain protein [Kalmanozyma brasiliensis GHG001]EST06789.1 NUDIX hydrolase domain protein [Kalmanozyma brasiliensis GHG001]
MSQTPTVPQAGSFPSFTTVNFYAGSKLNRLSWLRTSTEFLNSTIASPETRFVVMKNNNPLCHASGEDEGLLATLGWDEVKPYILENVKASGGAQAEEGDALVFGPQAYGLKNGGEVDRDFARATDGVGPSRLALVFLGIDESKLSETSLPGQMAKDTSKTSDAANSNAPPAGTPFFALSLTYRPPFLKDGEASPMQALLEKLENEEKYDFIDLRASSRAATWPVEDAAIVAQSKSLLDWNERHQYCPGCSRQQYSLWAGYKRGCSSSLGHAAPGSDFSTSFLSGGAASFEEDGKGVCPSTKVLSNFHYPRTDPVIIMAIISPDGEKVLLGRQKKWPAGFYSCLAGFCEPGESFEEAVRREVLEESGIKVDQVIYHSSQPWPYPTNLMAGFYGIAKSDNEKDIRLDLDNELEDARFYTRKEILEVIGSKERSHFTKQELENLDKEHNDDAEVKEKRKQIRLPPQTAIARVLVEAWANGQAVLPTHMEGFQRTRM